MKFPASTNTGFDDLIKLKPGDHFVFDGIPYEALGVDVRRSNGIEGVYISVGAGEFKVRTRTYTAPLSELLTDEEA